MSLNSMQMWVVNGVCAASGFGDYILSREGGEGATHGRTQGFAQVERKQETRHVESDEWLQQKQKNQELRQN